MASDDLGRELELFVSRWLGKKDRPSFVLVHASEGAPSVLDTCELEGDLAELPKAAEIADRLLRSADVHAASSSRPQRYSVCAQNGKGRVLGQHYFRLAPAPGAALELGHADTESATPTGVLSQSMRHTEAFARMHAEANGSMFRNLLNLVGILGKMVESNEQQRLDNMRLTQELLDRRHARELELRTAAEEQDRMARGLRMLEQGVLPMVAAHVSGASPVAELFKSLNQEQLEVIMGTMREEQLPHLRKIFESSQAAKLGADVIFNQGKDGSVGDSNGGAH